MSANNTFYQPSAFILDSIISNALTEDVGTGDITTLSVIPATTAIHGRLIAKEDGLVCGLPVFSRVF